MDPVDSDLFEASDFASSFTILDQTPGVATVANYGALTALPWGTAQHGRQVLELDNGALWYWYNPSGSGVWKRSNNVGLLAHVTQSAVVSTTATTGNGILVVQSGNVVVPGVRAIHISVRLGLDNSSGLGSQVLVSLTDNGALIYDSVFRAGTFISGSGNTAMLDFYTSGANNSTHNYAVYIRSAAGSTSIGAGGTSAARVCMLNISEV